MNCRCESLYGHLKERSNIQSPILGTQISSIQGFGAFNFHIWNSSFGRPSVKFSLESFQEGHEDAYDVSR